MTMRRWIHRLIRGTPAQQELRQAIAALDHAIMLNTAAHTGSDTDYGEMIAAEDRESDALRRVQFARAALLAEECGITDQGEDPVCPTCGGPVHVDLAGVRWTTRTDDA